MTRRITSDTAPREFQTTLRHGSIVYVPHFRNSSVFVGPGYPRFTKQRYSEEELIRLGATREKAPLWPRGTYGIVDDVKL
jgi:hypothetical protein